MIDENKDHATPCHLLSRPSSTLPVFEEKGAGASLAEQENVVIPVLDGAGAAVSSSQQKSWGHGFPVRDEKRTIEGAGVLTSWSVGVCHPDQ